jgi:hypothetical protein
MRCCCCYVLILFLPWNGYAQRMLRASNIESGSFTDIQEKDVIKCRYRVYKQETLLVGGVVRGFTDSSIIYKSGFNRVKEIPLSAITNIDRVPLKRTILPAVVVGLLAGGADAFLNTKSNSTTTGLLLSGGILLTLNYVYIRNHRKLNRNVVPSTVELSFIER